MLDLFKLRMNAQGDCVGDALKTQSDRIMDKTFTRDTAYKKCYIINRNAIFPKQDLDNYKFAKKVLMEDDFYDPLECEEFSPIDAKYLVHTYTTVSKDTPDYILQFRPTEHRDNKNIRVGALVFIPDDLKRYNLWMIVDKDDRPQFPKYYVLRCNWLAKWNVYQQDAFIYKNGTVETGTYFTWCVERTQNSYNSGIWTDYYTTIVENQSKLWMPTNQDTKTITYNTRFVIGMNEKRIVAWEISKVEDTTPVGVTKFTLKQELVNDNVDYDNWINMDNDDKDFYKIRTSDTYVIPELNEEDDASVIEFNGMKPVLKIGGSYKTFTANLHHVGEADYQFFTPYWTISCFDKHGLLLSVSSLIYDTLNASWNFVCDNDVRCNIVLVPHKCNEWLCECTKNDTKIFCVQLKRNVDNDNILMLKCPSDLIMLDKYIILKVQNSNASYKASLQLEVEPL